MTAQLPVAITVKGAKKAGREIEQFGRKGQRSMQSLEKATAPASRGLLALDKTTGSFKQSLLGTTSRLGAMGEGLAALGPAGLAGAVGLAAVVAVAAKLATMVRPALEFASALKAEAATAGLTTDAFQELQFVASQFNITQDAMTDGLKELALRADEFAKTGKGSAAEAFEQLGFSASEVNAQLGDTDALFGDVIKRIEELDTEAAQIRVADEIFGGQGGEQFVRLLAAGSEEIARMRAEAKALGVVMDEGLIERADEARRELVTLERIIDVQLNSALVDLAPVLETVVGWFAQAAKFTGEIVDGFREIENKSSRGLRDSLATLDEDLADRYRTVEIAKEDYDSALARQADPDQDPQASALINREVERLRDKVASAERNFEQVSGERDKVFEALKKRDENKKKPPGGGGGSGSGGFKEADPFADSVADLQFQIAQSGRTDLGRSISSELQSAGLSDAPENDDRVQKIRELVTALHDLEQAENAVKEADKQAQKVSAEGVRVTEKYQSATEAYEAEITNLINLYEQSAISTGTYTLAVEAAEERRLRASTNATDGMRRALLDYADAAGDAASIAQSATESAFSAMEGFAANFASAGKKSFSDFARSALADLSRVLFQQAVTKPLASSIGNALGGFSFGGLNLFAGGGIMTSGGAASLPVRTYEYGGIANTPQISIWGEGRLPEANIPLPDGRTVPVTLSGAGLGNGSGGGMLIQNYNSFHFAGSPAAPGGGLDPKIAETMAAQIESLVDQSVKKSLVKHNSPGGLSNRARTY